MSTDNNCLNLLKGSKSKNPLLKKSMFISLWTKIELNKYMSKNGKYNKYKQIDRKHNGIIKIINSIYKKNEKLLIIK